MLAELHHCTELRITIPSRRKSQIHKNMQSDIILKNNKAQM